LIFKEAIFLNRKEKVSSMLLNDMINLTPKSNETQVFPLDLLKLLSYPMLADIIASGREFDFNFQSMKDLLENENEIFVQGKKEVFDLIQAYRNEPERAISSLRSELGLSGMNFSKNYKLNELTIK